MRTRSVRVPVRMEAELTASPADEEAKTETDDDARNRRLRRLLNSAVGKILEIHQESPGRIHVVLIRQLVGF